VKETSVNLGNLPGVAGQYLPSVRQEVVRFKCSKEIQVSCSENCPAEKVVESYSDLF